MDAWWFFCFITITMYNMIRQKLKCVQTELYLPLARSGITIIDASCFFFFNSPLLFKTSKCLYPKLIHIIQIRVTEKMPYVAVHTFAFDCPRPSHWALGFSERRWPLQADDLRRHPDSMHVAHSLDLSKNHRTGTNTPWGIRASEGHTSTGER